MLGRQTIFFSLLISYAMVLILPTIISMVICSIIIFIVKEEIINANDSIISQISLNYDNKIDEVEKNMTQVALDSKIESLIKVNNHFCGLEQLALYETIQEIKKICATNSSISKMYIYFKNRDLVLTSSAGM